jgi:CheY-like chemotaxis protein
MTDYSDLNVLVADDDPLFLDFIKIILNNLGIRDVVSVGDGTDAVRKIIETEQNFDLVICDYQMPGFSGMDVFRLIRKAGIPAKFVMITTRDRNEDAETISGGGCENFIAKPIEPKTLRDTLEAILQES